MPNSLSNHNRLPCAFAKTILNGKYSCAKSCSFHVAERHGINCTEQVASNRCAAFNKIIFSKVKFVLQTSIGAGSLPALKKLQLQLGSLTALFPDLDSIQPDINQLINQAEKQYLDFNRLPFKKIAQSIQKSRPRKRTKR